MTTQSAELPAREKVVAEDGLMFWRWRDWFRDLRADVNTSTGLVQGGSVTLASKSAAVALKAFDTASLTSGQYNVSAFTQILTAASANSSVIVTFHFTRHSIACTVSAPAVTSNDPTLPGTFVGMVTIDAGTPISYSVAYVSNLAGMIYTTDLVLTRVNA